MARHALHNRAPQRDNLPSQIQAPSGDIGGASIATASAAPVLTVITTTQEFIESVTGGTGFSTKTAVVTSSITDASQFAALTQATSTTSSSRTSSSTTSATSSPASKKSSSNLSTLIPAIVVPVVVVLLASFGLFWFCMRRKANRELKNADFVMAGRGEKLSSRTNSSRSATTGTTAAEKASPMVVTSEFKPPQSYNSGPKYSMEDIGVARPLTPKDGTGPTSPRRTPNRQHGGSSRDRPQYTNFSGPRPSTARDRQAPSKSQGRMRSNSSPHKRGPPPSAYDRSRGPPPGRPSPEFRGGPSPSPRQGPGPSPIPPSGAFPSARGLPAHPRPAPAPPGPPRMRQPSPTMDRTGRAAPPPTLRAPPPGAFNGASSISQYSPIIKETPRLGSGDFQQEPIGVAGVSSKPQTSDGSRAPPPIKTNHLEPTSRSLSPTSPSGNFLTEENMRIARLANSSRLGFFNTSATSPAAGNTLDKALNVNAPQTITQTAKVPAGHSPATQSNPSPKLPPPATRSQLIPNDSPADDRKTPFNYFGTNHSRDGSMNSDYHSQPKQQADNQSIISDLEAYDDIDAKSDVSSLNEFERFEFDDSQRGSGSVRGLGFNSPSGYRASPGGNGYR